MRVVPSLSALEQRLAQARAEAPGTCRELDALIALAARLVSDPRRRGELAGEGIGLAGRLGDEVARVRCRAMAVEYAGRHGQPPGALAGPLAAPAAAERTGDPPALAQARPPVG